MAGGYMGTVQRNLGPPLGSRDPQLLGHKVLSMSLPPRALVFLPVR